MEFKIIRHLDNTGRICIPRDMRHFFRISPKTRISVETTEVGILLRVERTPPRVE